MSRVVCVGGRAESVCMCGLALRVRVLWERACGHVFGFLLPLLHRFESHADWPQHDHTPLIARIYHPRTVQSFVQAPARRASNRVRRRARSAATTRAPPAPATPQPAARPRARQASARALSPARRVPCCCGSAATAASYACPSRATNGARCWCVHGVAGLGPPMFSSQLSDVIAAAAHVAATAAARVFITMCTPCACACFRLHGVVCRRQGRPLRTPRCAAWRCAALWRDDCAVTRVRPCATPAHARRCGPACMPVPRSRAPPLRTHTRGLHRGAAREQSR